jgi:phospholipid/cholesterol/gamma-HCH transport system substrate-binding protein
VKRANEFLVGLVVLVALAVVVAGALWLSETKLGAREELAAARFRTVGGLKVGAPVTLRGVRVGRVEAIRLADDGWVEADMKLYEGVEIPKRPAAIAASASLFGEWALTVASLDDPQEDPNVRVMLAEATKPGGVWPGATLPDIGQLTAQASRIASDIASLTDRVGSAFDSATVQEMRESIHDFSEVVSQLSAFTRRTTTRLDMVTGDVQNASSSIASASRDARAVLGRLDSATANGNLQAILDNTRSASANIDSTTEDVQQLIARLRAHEANLVQVLEGADSVMGRLAQGRGTLGMLSQDSTLYNETTATVVELRKLIADIQANPRKYFKFSVF